MLPYLSPIADAYAACDLAIARAGAISTAELCAWGIASILVPLPTAAQDHQTSNARALAGANAAVNLKQADLTDGRLEQEVLALTSNPDKLRIMSEAAVARSRPNAAHDIAQRILRMLELKQIPTTR